MYYLNYFLIFSIIGHFVETFIYYNGESGILYGWWTPVYGFGVVTILIINNICIKYIKNDFIKFITLFFSCSLILSILEALGGYLIEWLFGITFWDYSNYKFNFGKYIAVEMAIIWGLSGILVIYFIKPFFNKIISKIPKYLTYILTLLMLVDFIATLFFKH